MKISKACFSHPLKIGIDARLYGPKDTGIGRYVENLVVNLLKVDKNNSYVLFVRKNSPLLNLKFTSKRDSLKGEISNLKLVMAEARHYSLKEQFLMPYLIWREKVNLMHFPHFNVPVFFFGRYLVTIHDLVKHTSRGTSTTTRNSLFYWLKYFGYKIVFWLAVKKARKILVPSKTIALQLRKAYGVSEDKLVVTYEGVDNKLKVKSEKLNVEEVLGKYKIKKPFLLYVGSVYPHKNIPNLIKAVKILNQSTINDQQLAINLVIVCARSVFWERLKKELENLKAQNFVKLIGFLPDEELAVLYKKAEAFIFPSESEGFGLPGLEAIAAGLPVLASDIPVFKEIYQEAALYFDPTNHKDIAEKIKKFLSDKNLEEELKTKGSELAKDYSWLKMVKETLNEYQSV